MSSHLVASDAGISAPAAVSLSPAILTVPVIDCLRVKAATAENFSTFLELLDLQALDHQTTVKGGEEGLDALRKALFSPDPREQILQGILLETDEGDPVGYMLISEMHSDEGNVLYLEDNFVKEEFRSGGIGTYMFDMLRVIAAAKGQNTIACTVDESRQATQRFYLKKCDMHQRPDAPVLGMGDFHIANTAGDANSVAIVCKNQLGTIIADSDGSLHVSAADIAEKNLRGVVIHDAHVDTSRVVRLTHDHIDQLQTLPQEAFYIGEQVTPKDHILLAMRNAVDHPRNFALAVLGQTGEVECVTLGAETFSTFNSYKRANIGAPISTTGAPADASQVLSQVAFCQQMPGYSRLELQLDHLQAKKSGLSGMFQACGSKMTEQAGSDELKFSVDLEDISFAVRSLSTEVLEGLHAIPGLMEASKPLPRVYAEPGSTVAPAV